MTPGARIQATIHLLDQILESWQSPKRIPADKLIESYFKSNRYAGSKDRGAIAELTYWCLRHKATLEWWIAKYNLETSGRLMTIAGLILRRDHDINSLKTTLTDSNHAPGSLSSSEEQFARSLSRMEVTHHDMPTHIRLNYPEWLDEKLTQTFGDKLETALHALSEQAPTDLRVNTLKTSREQLISDLRAEGFECKETKLSPIGIRLAKRAPIFTSKYFKLGHFEVQDEGSQMLALITDARAGQKVIDFCAGAGGKTLAIAAAMQNKGRILAWDISAKRLDQIKQRLKRAGVDNVQSHVLESEHDSFIKRHKATADRVLVDAPCSGSGTWRRNPDLKWRFTPTDLAEVCAKQSEILQSASRLVKKDGRLIYATCSIFADENATQIENFIKNNPHFRVVSHTEIWNKEPSLISHGSSTYFSVTPHEDGVDGFFAAVLEKTGEGN